ncbi:hypothetical protein Zmor_008035 [Zophobas morio]|uniref:CTNNB1 binding N-teminal domain-containing protein n=1 Tax=Zophobas morio TaxID=2755281 RepID=A0AA38IUP3_9CUCU|nr:hypothetical protein Zmor_008035 [Zophobas morio]
MPHVSSSGGDDLGSTDEVKVFKDEGDGEDEKRSSENLTEEKSSLIDLTESEEKSGGSYSSNKNVSRADHSPVFGKVEPVPHTSSFNMGYLVSPYSYPNGAAGPIPVSMLQELYGEILSGIVVGPKIYRPAYINHSENEPFSIYSKLARKACKKPSNSICEPVLCPMKISSEPRPYLQYHLLGNAAAADEGPDKPQFHAYTRTGELFTSFMKVVKQVGARNP